MRSPLLIGRRRLGLLAAGSLLARPAAAATVPTGRITCKVIRGGHDVGRAIYDFEHDADALTVSISVDLRIALGFVTLFRYVHANVEQWRGDHLMHFASHTNNNGHAEQATGEWNGVGLSVTGTKTQPYVAPPYALGTTYWNPRTVHDPLINSQDGRLLKVHTVDIGPSEAVQASGDTVAANEYSITGDLRLNLWYDARSILAGLQYYAHDGSVLNYEKL